MRKIYRYGNIVIDWENQWIYYLDGVEVPIAREYSYIREVKEAIYLDEERLAFQSKMKMSCLLDAMENNEIFQRIETEKLGLRQQQDQIQARRKALGDTMQEEFQKVIAGFEKDDKYWLSYVGGESNDLAKQRQDMFLGYGIRLEGFYPETAQWALKAYRWLVSDEKVLEGLRRFGPLIKPVQGYRLIECPSDDDKRYIGSKDGTSWYVLTDPRFGDGLVVEAGPFSVDSPGESLAILAAIKLQKPGEITAMAEIDKPTE